MIEKLTEAELKERRKEHLAAARARRCEMDRDNEYIETYVDLVEYQYYAAAQAQLIASLERQLRRLRDVHRAHEFVRDAARDYELDATTLAYAFTDWLNGLSDKDLEGLRKRSVERKSEWAGPL